ncbi:MAG: hypothetical protein ABII00_10335 [Elusimicrobiota bacterium]
MRRNATTASFVAAFLLAGAFSMAAFGRDSEGAGKTGIKSLYERGVDAYAGGSLDDARRFFRMILAVEPGNRSAARALERVEKEMSQAVAGGAPKPAGKPEAGKKAVRALCDPATETRADYEFGVDLYAEGGLRDSFCVFSKILRDEPENEAAGRALERVQEELLARSSGEPPREGPVIGYGGDAKAVRIVCSSSLTAHPEHERGVDLYAQGRLEEAHCVFSALRRKEPANRSFERALSRIRKEIAQDPPGRPY